MVAKYDSLGRPVNEKGELLFPEGKGVSSLVAPSEEVFKLRAEKEVLEDKAKAEKDAIFEAKLKIAEEASKKEPKAEVKPEEAEKKDEPEKEKVVKRKSRRKTVSKTNKED